MLPSKSLNRDLYRNEALIEAFHSLKHRLTNYALSRLDDKDLAEDLVQEAFEKALVRQSRESRDPVHQDSAQINSLQAWLLRVIRNAIVDHYRKRESELKQSNLMASLDLHEKDLEHNLEIHSLLAEHLSPFIDRLPKKYRQVLLAKDVQGKSIKEIASQMNLSSSAVKTRLHRGRLMLKDKLIECCDFDVKDGIIQDMHPRCKDQ